MNERYYADLNPRFGARYENRYAVFIRRSATDRVQTYLQYVTRRSAENAATRLNKQEADPHAGGEAA